MYETTYSVYVKTDEQSNITAINSSAFLADTTGWTKIDEGCGDNYHHAQGNYFDGPIATMAGIYRYKLIEGQPIAKTEDEIAAEIAALPPLPPTAEEQTQARLDGLDELMLDTIYRQALLEWGVTP